MRVAYCSPLPPERSGIADYSAELLPHLTRHMEVELFSDDVRSAAERMAGDLPVHPASTFAERRQRYDLAIYHVGNHAGYHAWIYRLALEHPGMLVLHEYVLHHLIQGMTLARGRGAPFIEEMRYAYGALGERLARRQVETGMPIDPWKYPLFERVVDASLGVLTHNRTTRDRVLASRPGTPIEVVPHHLAVDALPTGGGVEMRARWGLKANTFLVASFGFVTPYKRLEVSLRAFAELRRRVPDCHFVVAGEVSSHYDLDSLLEGELGEGVTVTGRLELPDLLAAMDACDAAVNLRHPTGGETSGTLIRLLGLGKAVVVSDQGSFSEIPDGCCAKVPLDESEVATLAEYLVAFAERPDLREAVAGNARRHMRAHHGLESSAAGYAALSARLAGQEPPFRPAPPLARAAMSTSENLIAEVGVALADLGVRDDDSAALESVSQTFVELGCTASGAADSGRG